MIFQNQPLFFITMNPTPPPITTKAMTAIAIISPILPPPSSSTGSGASGVGANATGVAVGSNGVTTGVAVGAVGAVGAAGAAGALGFAVGATAGMAVGAGI
ncbi:uncharacterized protein METZ01_LOCUS478731 [marine metagenome]|uniref:Uncharacterized protein n=1 Tax=marine metagenome TaxID=408172 RepID=A0A383C0D4_9ZZZZ